MLITMYILGLFFLYIISSILTFIYRKLRKVNPIYSEIYLFFLIAPLIILIIISKTSQVPHRPSFSECRMRAIERCTECKIMGNYESCEIKFEDPNFTEWCYKSLSGKDLKGNSFIINCTEL
jgi:hypothetical protein